MKFQVGDKVHRIRGSYEGMIIGDIGVIVQVQGDTGFGVHYVIGGFGTHGHSEDSLELLE